jgi:hypothetical protein
MRVARHHRTHNASPDRRRTHSARGRGRGWRDPRWGIGAIGAIPGLRSSPRGQSTVALQIYRCGVFRFGTLRRPSEIWDESKQER